MKVKILFAALAAALACGLAHAQMRAAPANATVPAGYQAPTTYQFAFQDTPLRMVLDRYSAISGDPVDIAPGVLETFSFTSDANLLRDEAIARITAELALKRIHLVMQKNGRLRAERIP